MMDIINIVLTCVFLCVMNTGVIFIMDKISKLMGDNIIHAIKMVLLVGAGAAVYIMTYYGINSWVNGTYDYYRDSDCTVYRTDNN
jgi:two-component system sensor histidine kinase AgrC